HFIGSRNIQERHSSLDTLDLSRSGLTGLLHDFMFFNSLVSSSLFVNMRSLLLAGNKLAGQLPTSFDAIEINAGAFFETHHAFPQLVVFDITSTLIEGPVPETWNGLQQLQVLARVM